MHLSLLALFSLGAWFADRAIAAPSMQYFTNATLPSKSLTPPCADALMATLPCDPYVKQFNAGDYFKPDGLARACKADCDAALGSWQASVNLACAGQSYQDTRTALAPVAKVPDLKRYLYNLTCLQADGVFCNVWAFNLSWLVDQHAAIPLDNTARPSGNKTQSSSAGMDVCHECNIKTLQFQASSPYEGGAGVVSIYSSQTASCHRTDFPLLSTVTATVHTPTTTTEIIPTCSGKSYQIQANDDCGSISKSQGTSTSWLLVDNNLFAYCDKFPKSGSLCIGHQCKTYTVKENGTCSGIASASNVTYAQVLRWNPIVGRACNNLKNSIGSELCISNPAEVHGTPTASIPTQSSAATAAAIPTDIAINTSTNCATFYKVVPTDYCNVVVLKFGILLADFVFLNPEINANCTNLFAGESYCVQPVGPIEDYPGHPGYIAPSSSISDIPYSSFPTATFVPPSLESLRQQ